VFALEFARQQMWHPQIVLVAICFLAIAFSLACFRFFGGPELFRAELFPMLFFLTAIPWPARLEQPITGGLMRAVAVATTEILHWLGVEAETSGGAIALRDGLVGITEACSGIRSLQAGLMFGLAMGEWFLLRPTRRIVLLGIAVLAALATNLTRTLTLALQAERHGVASVEQIHDLTGNFTITALVATIWLAGKWLAPKTTAAPLGWDELRQRLRDLGTSLFAPAHRGLAFAAVICLVSLIAARAINARLETGDHAQLGPFFVAAPSASAGDETIAVPKEIWNELRPTSGEYIRRQDATLPHGFADLYHFYWKPSPWNRFLLVHRPDICMPGVGWESMGAPEAFDLNFDGKQVRFYAFRFQRGIDHALQMWGVWRNGDSVPLDYEAAQILGTAPPPANLALEGKRRSATEIVACTLFREQSAPPAEIAVALLRSVFKYSPQ
jgi:exosortase